MPASFWLITAGFGVLELLFFFGVQVSGKRGERGENQCGPVLPRLSCCAGRAGSKLPAWWRLD